MPQAHVLWSASEVVHNPGHKGRIHLHRCQLDTQKSRPDGVESTGEIVRETAGLWRLWHWNEAGRLPYHRDPLEAQAHVEDTMKQSTELLGAGSENPWADTIRACSLTSGEFAQLSPYMKQCKQCRLRKGRFGVHSERRAGSKGARRGVRGKTT